ncbi:MAG: gfo/Idh/MocA family oxidoreductase [Microbacteriaceae bacterium]|nr:MAG: gfo/Idh/MocA family oxidoreductase [Microbacteriaceae bacterium]
MTEVAEPLRWAVVGASWIAADRVIPALRATGQSVAALVSSDAAHGAAYAAEHGIPRVVSSIDALADGEVDAVYIGTSNERHRAASEAAAARGLHVLLEKPMADRLDDARAIVAACAAAGVVLAVDHHLVASAAFRIVRELVADGAIGELRAVRVEHAKLLPEFLRTWRIGDGPGAGVVADLTPHDASLVDALLAPRRPLEVSALAVRQGGWGGGAPDAVASVVRYEGEVLVTLHDGFTTPHAASGVEVLGTEGSIWAEELLAQDPVARVVLRDAAGEREVPVAGVDLYEATVGAFVDAVRGRGRAFVDGGAGLRAAELAFAVQRSIEEGQVIRP